MLTSETLNRAADLIEERGWTQGHGGMVASVRNLCIEGAVAVAAGVGLIGDGTYSYADTRECPAGAAVCRYLREGTPWRWNDAAGRTAEQVIEVLRAAAVIESAKETADERELVSA